MSAKENEEINKTVKELNKISQDPDEVAKYEEREWNIVRYNVEMKTNRELGEKVGKEEGRREEKINVVKKLHSIDMPIKQIAEVVEMNVEEVEKIINGK